MNGFFEDLEDGCEPIESDEDWWQELDEKWGEVDNPPIPPRVTRQIMRLNDEEVLVILVEACCKATQGGQSRTLAIIVTDTGYHLYEVLPE